MAITFGGHLRRPSMSRTGTHSGRSASHSHSHSRARSRSRSRHEVLEQATIGVVCRLERLERRCLMSSGLVSGVKMEDVNGSGTIDAADQPVGGVTIYADLNNNAVREANEPSTVTAAT